MNNSNLSLKYFHHVLRFHHFKTISIFGQIIGLLVFAIHTHQYITPLPLFLQFWLNHPIAGYKTKKRKTKRSRLTDIEFSWNYKLWSEAFWKFVIRIYKDFLLVAYEYDIIQTIATFSYVIQTILFWNSRADIIKWIILNWFGNFNLKSKDTIRISYNHYGHYVNSRERCINRRNIFSFFFFRKIDELKPFRSKFNTFCTVHWFHYIKLLARKLSRNWE